MHELGLKSTFCNSNFYYAMKIFSSKSKPFYWTQKEYSVKLSQVEEICILLNSIISRFNFLQSSNFDMHFVQIPTYRKIAVFQ